MSLKPADQRSPLASRDAIWNAIRATKGKDGHPNQHFTARTIRGETGATLATVREYLTGLHRSGYIEAVGKSYPDTGKIAANIYQLVRDNGIEPPKVRRDGTEITQGRAQENMWRTMRVLKNFSAKDLAIQASTEEIPVAETAAKDYCSNLHKAGYLQLTSPGTPKAQARYYFPAKSYTGPKPPMVQRINQVYDPNTKKVVWKGVANDAV